ncbi:MAG: NADH-quinone oxidoreductase subunit J [Acidobacteriaceae bacterium]
MTTFLEWAFYVAGAIAVISTVMAITRVVAVHALLYLIVSLLALAVVFYSMGAPLIAALEVIIYAGAIVVLFLFVVMMLNLGGEARETERQWLAGKAWIGPVILSAILLAEIIYLITQGPISGGIGAVAGPKEVGLALYGPYLIGVELASMLLLGALVGASHLGKSEART